MLVKKEQFRGDQSSMAVWYVVRERVSTISMGSGSCKHILCLHSFEGPLAKNFSVMWFVLSCAVMGFFLE